MDQGISSGMTEIQFTTTNPCFHDSGMHGHSCFAPKQHRLPGAAKETRRVARQRNSKLTAELLRCRAIVCEVVEIVADVVVDVVVVFLLTMLLLMIMLLLLLLLLTMLLMLLIMTYSVVSFYASFSDF